MSCWRFGLVGTALAVLFLGGGCGRELAPAAPPAVAPRPNVIYILIDTLRADRLGAYAPARRLSPTLDALAAEGVVFERAMATAPWTLASVASLFSGLYPSVHQATDYQSVAGAQAARVGQVRAFSEDHVTLAEVFHHAGYQTAAVSANPFIVPKHGFAQGFEHFDALATATHAPGDAVNRSALAWVERRDPTRPFLLYLHYMDPHAPYRAAPELLEPLIDAVEKLPDRRELTKKEQRKYRNYFFKSMVEHADDPRHERLRGTLEYWHARYDAGVRQVDAHVAALRDALTAMNLWDDALLIITADHGEALGEHGYWGHGTCAYQHQLHVPLILRWKGHWRAGQRVTPSVGHFDLYPTLLDCLRLPSSPGVQAASLRPLLDGTEREHRWRMAEAVNTQPNLKAVVHGDWKALYDVQKKTGELFDLAADPGEIRDLSQARGAEFAGLVGRLEQQMAANQQGATAVQATQVNVSEEERRRFEAIGYLGGAEPDDEPEEP